MASSNAHRSLAFAMTLAVVSTPSWAAESARQPVNAAADQTLLWLALAVTMVALALLHWWQGRNLRQLQTQVRSLENRLATSLNDRASPADLQQLERQLGNRLTALEKQFAERERIAQGKLDQINRALDEAMLTLGGRLHALEEKKTAPAHTAAQLSPHPITLSWPRWLEGTDRAASDFRSLVADVAGQANGPISSCLDRWMEIDAWSASAPPAEADFSPWLHETIRLFLQALRSSGRSEAEAPALAEKLCQLLRPLWLKFYPNLGTRGFFPGMAADTEWMESAVRSEPLGSTIAECTAFAIYDKHSQPPRPIHKALVSTL